MPRRLQQQIPSRFALPSAGSAKSLWVFAGCLGRLWVRAGLLPREFTALGCKRPGILRRGP